MKCIIICCLLVMGMATPPPPIQQNKKIGLDDIERDNLKTEKIQTRTVLSKLPPTNYHGFVAYKTANDYVRQQPRGQYLQADLSPPPLHQQQYHRPQQQQYHHPQQQQQQQYQIIPQFYYQQPEQQSNYQQYENLQYINDNSVVQQTQQQQQQYYTPYVYLQQSPSTPIQTVIDPNNGHLRYIMYIPAYTTQKTEPTQNYETVAQPTTTTTDEQQYTGDTQYVIQSIPQQQQYAEEPQQPKTRYFTTKHEPKSLLDSYVPSIYQIQYYKQQQQQQQQQQQAQTNANSIENLYKTTQPIGKTEYTKIKPQQTSESKTNLNYYIPNNYH